MDIERARKRYIPMSETMLYILVSLLKERHGYGIMQYVKELTKGELNLGAGTIYQSLAKLEGDGLIVPVREEERRKIYIITDGGRQILKEETARIRELYRRLEWLL